MKKIKNPWIGQEGYQCIGCCPTNDAGVKMEFYEDGDDIVSLWKPQAKFQGWINVLHGGIQALLLDEISGWVVSRKLQTAAVTAKMELQFKKSISINEECLEIRGRVLSQRRNLAEIEACIYDGNKDLCCRSVATFFCMTKEKAAAEMGFLPFELED
jgi:acyl-coenzyme A thioesterase PaaI-like protein